MVKIPPIKTVLQGKEYYLRNQGNWYEAYRIICLLNDGELTIQQKWAGAIVILFPDYEEIFESRQKYNEACAFVKYFIDKGSTEEKSYNGKAVNISFLQDIEMIIESLNVSKDRDIRLSYIHWWTFLGDLHNHQPSGNFKTVLGIRYKLKNNTKLEVWEREFYNNNRSLVELENELNAEEQKFLDSILGTDC